MFHPELEQKNVGSSTID